MFPNPGIAVTVRVYLPVLARMAADPVSTHVYDVHGKLISKLINTSAGQGHFDFVWDGTDSMGRSCRAGVYFVRVEMGPFSQSMRIILPR